MIRVSGPVKSNRAGKATAIPANTFVTDYGVFADMCARPMSNAEPLFERFLAEIGVEIGVAGPRDIRLGHLHLNVCTRRQAVPEMVLSRIKRKSCGVGNLGIDADLTPHLSAKRIEQALVAFDNIDFQMIACPTNMAWTDLEIVFIA